MWRNLRVSDAYYPANSDADRYGNLHFNCEASGDFHVHANADRNLYGYSPCNGERLAHLDPDAYPDTAAEPHCNAHCHGHRNPNAVSERDADAVAVTDALSERDRDAHSNAAFNQPSGRRQLRRSDERR